MNEDDYTGEDIFGPFIRDHNKKIVLKTMEEVYNRLVALVYETENCKEECITVVDWSDIDCLFAELKDEVKK